MYKLIADGSMVFAVGAIAFASPVVAQDAGGIFRDVQRGVDPKGSEVDQPPALGSGETASPEDPSQHVRSGESFRVTGFRIESISIPEEELLPEVQAFVGRDCTMSDLREAAARIAAAYRSRSLLAYVAIPRQTLREGIVVFRVAEARLGEVVIEAAPGLRLDRNLAESFIRSRVKERGAVRLDKVVQGISALRAIPGVEAHGTLRAGKAHGATDLSLRISEKPLFTSTVVVDNHTSPLLGSVRGLAVFGLNDFDHGGSQLLLTSQWTKRSQYAEVSLAKPAFNGRLWLDSSLSFVGYKIPSSADGPEASGGGGVVNLALRWNASAEARSTLKLISSLEYRWFNNDVDEIRISANKLYVFSLSAQRVMRSERGRSTVVDLRLRVGHLDLGAKPDNLSFDLSTARTQGGFARLTGSIAQAFAMREDLTFEIAFRGQLATKNLNGIERVAFGGPGSIAGYSISALDGDEGVLTSLALSKRLSASSQISASWAGGVVVQHKRPWKGWSAGSGDRNLYGFQGVGASAQFDLVGRLHLSAEVGVPLIRQPSSLGNGGRPVRAWLQLVKVLG